MSKIMTEQEWLAQSDKKKNEWLTFNIREYYPRPTEKVSLLNWQGFGMIVEKADYFYLSKSAISDEYLIAFIKDSIVWQAVAPTPWEAAALAYGKMKGLIKYGVE